MNPTEKFQLESAGFRLNQDGEWVKGRWSILLHDDFVTLGNTTWVCVDTLQSIAQAIDVVTFHENGGDTL